LKVDSLRTSLAHETKSLTRLAAIDALLAALWVDCRSRLSQTVTPLLIA